MSASSSATAASPPPAARPRPPAVPTVGNVVVLRGVLTTAPSERELPAGGRVVSFDVATRGLDGGTGIICHVPVAWLDPTAADRRPVDVGSEVLVSGTVRRRFFRHGGVTQSRTEVVASRVVPVRRRAAARSLVSAVRADLEAIGA